MKKMMTMTMMMMMNKQISFALPLIARDPSQIFIPPFSQLTFALCNMQLVISNSKRMCESCVHHDCRSKRHFITPVGLLTPPLLAVLILTFTKDTFNPFTLKI